VTAPRCQCPTCGQVVTAPWGARDLSALQLRLVQSLIGQRRLTVHQLTDALWGSDPEGGPLYPAVTIHLTKEEVNRRMPAARVEVLGRGRGAIYSLRDFR